jgi:hypothetical protein
MSMNGTGRHVFTSRDKIDGKVKPIKSIYKGFVNACRRAGIENMEFRDLRTIVATHLHKTSVDALVISKAILRYKKFKTTENCYLNSDIDHWRNTLNNVQFGTNFDTRRN